LKVENSVLAVLSSATTNGNSLFLTGQLGREMYLKVNKVLEAAGGKWSRKDKAHVFGKDAAERIDEIILSGEVEIPKDEFNYFPTPPNVLSYMMELACIRPGMRVLEPSAGQGAIVDCLVGRCALIHAVELLEDNYAVLGEKLSRQEMTASKGYIELVEHGDFLTSTPKPIYDRVVMNPPFTKQQDIKHVTHAVKFLKPGGILVSVMSAGVSFRQNKATVEFRELVEAHDGAIYPLPMGSFKESGTMVNTVVVKLFGMEGTDDKSEVV
jgi:protein-L-isoaspartate O-methyltransferase